MIGSANGNGVTKIGGTANAPPPTLSSPPPSLGPTRIGGTTPAAPKVATPTKTTVIRAPSVIGGGQVPPPAPPPPPQVVAQKPTGIPQGKPAPPPPPAPLVITTPSAMPGTIRKGLEVVATDLEIRFPGATPETLKKAMRILKCTVVETLNGATCSQWGFHLQSEYTKLVDESLKLTSSAAVRDGMRHAARLYALLTEVAATFQGAGSKSLLSWKKTATPWEKLAEVRVELDQLRTYLGSILSELRTTQTRLEGISDELMDYTHELDASSIAAQFVADHLGASDARAQHLQGQSLTLAKMIAHITEGVLLRKSTIDEIDALADKIQESILVTLPAWIEKISLTSQKTSVTDTERYTLRQGLEEILNKLK